MLIHGMLETCLHLGLGQVIGIEVDTSHIYRKGRSHIRLEVIPDHDTVLSL